MKLLNIIEASTSLECRGGLTCNLVKTVTKRYRLDDVIVLAETTPKLSKLKLTKKQDPDEIKDEIAVIENEYRCAIDESTRFFAQNLPPIAPCTNTCAQDMLCSSSQSKQKLCRCTCPTSIQSPSQYHEHYTASLAPHYHHHHNNVIGVVVIVAIPNNTCVGDSDSLASLFSERETK